MIYIFLGDDSIASRAQYIAKRKDYEEKGIELREITKENLEEMVKWNYESQSLFEEKKVFFGENLLSKKEQRTLLMNFDTTQTGTNILLWEGQSEERVVKFFFKHAQLIATKLPTTIFTLLDSLYPSNFRTIIPTFKTLCETVDENMIFFMFSKRIRELLMIKSGEALPKLASWQLAKLSKQASFWKDSELRKFYDSLYRIDVMNKTSGNYYSVGKALDILFCFYV